MRNINSPEIYRGMGFLNESSQQALLDLHVGIAGTGGAGYLVAQELAKAGVQNFHVADPEAFDYTNAGRVLGAGDSTVGKNKAEVLQEYLLNNQNDANVRIFKDGVTTDNLEEFMQGVDVVLDATELSMPELGTMIARAARKKTIPVVNVEYVGFAGQGTVFHPNSKTTFEQFMGIKGGNNAPLDEVKDQSLDPSRYLAYVPPYGDWKTFAAVTDKEQHVPLPSHIIGASAAASIAVAEFMKIARVRANTRTLQPTYAPAVRWYDAYTNKSGHTRHPRLSFVHHLGIMGTRNLLGLNEQASYTSKERAARGDVDLD
jgi:molybdopterin/thiamine biosynthesis adenylyltransferase